MGRLFWKILLTFWVTLLLTAAFFGIAAWLHQHGPHHPPALIHATPLVKAAQLPNLAAHHGPTRHRPKLTPLLVWVGIGILTSLLASLWLAWYFTQPLIRLQTALRAVAKGDFNQRLKPLMGRRRDEITDLGRDFDHMVAQLDTLMTAQRRLLHDVSHELRSPLARLQVSVGLIRQQPTHLAAGLRRIELEAGRLDRLVGELLTLSRLEAGVVLAHDAYLDVIALLDTVVQDARFEAQTRPCALHWSYQGAETALLLGHGELLFRAFENVVRNALHHTAPDTVVSVTAYVDADAIHVTVDDAGPGVPAAELELIFQPFQRGGQAQRQRAGYGLGLAIAKRAIESHGGTIRASARPSSKGLSMRIRLPLTQLPS